MKYNVATVDCSPLAEWQADVLMQELADLGFDSFEQESGRLRAYIPAGLTGEPSACASTLQEALRAHGAVLLSFEPCADADWNAVWESEHEPEELPLGVRIVPHCAFGAGHHETTAMMIEALRGADVPGRRVFDHGTGTGVLAIFAKRLGAAYVLADDIDENSVRNAQENAALNDADIDVVLSAQDGSSPLDGAAAPFDLIMANIHRNVLLAQMADYARGLSSGGELWLSGFYEADVPALRDAAVRCGLQHRGTRTNGEWCMLAFRKP